MNDETETTQQDEDDEPVNLPEDGFQRKLESIAGASSTLHSVAELTAPIGVGTKKLASASWKTTNKRIKKKGNKIKFENRICAHWCTRGVALRSVLLPHLYSSFLNLFRSTFSLSPVYRVNFSI